MLAILLMNDNQFIPQFTKFTFLKKVEDQNGTHLSHRFIACFGDRHELNVNHSREDEADHGTHGGASHGQNKFNCNQIQKQTKPNS